MKATRITLISFLTVLLLAACQDDANEVNEENNYMEETNESSENNEVNEENDTSNEGAEEIDGTLWEGDGNTGVILSHGAVYDADSWEEQGEELEENGFVAFAVEDTAPEKIIDAANMLQDDYGVDEVAVIGASAGGSSVIDAIEEDAFDFTKAAFLSPGGDASVIEDMPVLVIYSEDEGYDDLEDSADLETLSLSGGAHAQEMFDDEKKGEQVMDALIDFLNE